MARINKTLLPTGISRLSYGASYHKRGLWAIKAKHGGKLPIHEKKPKPVVEEKVPKFYPADDAPRKAKKVRLPKPTKLRPSITPGTVLILLAGRFMGKRVVFLKQLPSGLLLVTGPYKINGVPLRRVNQAYVIATSTKVDVSGVDTSKIQDDYFKAKAVKKPKGESQFFEPEKEEKHQVSAEKKEDQKAVDDKIIPAILAVPLLKEYMAKRFSLKQGQRPHLMQF